MKLKLLVGILTTLVICLLLYVFLGMKDRSQQGEIVSIENIKVFENFQMKKDYDKMLEKDLYKESSRLDSLGKLLQSLEANAQSNSGVLAVKRTEFYEAKQLFDQRFNELSKEYTAQVYSRLNEYITAYGKERGYRLIVGANGQGNVMYVAKIADVTEAMIKYANKKYLNN